MNIYDVLKRGVIASGLLMPVAAHAYSSSTETGKTIQVLGGTADCDVGGGGGKFRFAKGSGFKFRAGNLSVSSVEIIIVDGRGLPVNNEKIIVSTSNSDQRSDRLTGAVRIVHADRDGNTINDGYQLDISGRSDAENFRSMTGVEFGCLKALTSSDRAPPPAAPIQQTPTHAPGGPSSIVEIHNSDGSSMGCATNGLGGFTLDTNGKILNWTQNLNEQGGSDGTVVLREGKLVQSADGKLHPMLEDVGEGVKLDGRVMDMRAQGRAMVEVGDMTSTPLGQFMKDQLPRLRMSCQRALAALRR